MGSGDTFKLCEYNFQQLQEDVLQSKKMQVCFIKARTHSAGEIQRIYISIYHNINKCNLICDKKFNYKFRFHLFSVSNPARKQRNNRRSFVLDLKDLYFQIHAFVFKYLNSQNACRTSIRTSIRQVSF